MTSPTQTDRIRLGIIGMSEGNGHPYSWSAIFNGYEAEAMRESGFPVILDYLSQHTEERDYLGHLGEVTHVYSQDAQLSQRIASASRIPNVCDRVEDMVGRVDAVLLARDDVETRRSLAGPFLEAGIPIFIDKPLAVETDAARQLLDVPGARVFTCSALRFAQELQLSAHELSELGDHLYVEACSPKSWQTYAVHALEPVVAWPFARGRLLSVTARPPGYGGGGGVHSVVVEWERLTLSLRTMGDLVSPIQLHVHGSGGHRALVFRDSFSAFRASLERFVGWVRGHAENIPIEETMEIVEILERGSPE